jgi:hypothetical protein
VTDTLLSIEGFQDLLDRLGGDLSAWPAPQQASANALLAISPDAQTMLAAARRLDADLRAQPKAPAGLVDRIMAASGAKPLKE